MQYQQLTVIEDLRFIPFISCLSFDKHLLSDRLYYMKLKPLQGVETDFLVKGFPMESTYRHSQNNVWSEKQFKLKW